MELGVEGEALGGVEPEVEHEVDVGVGAGEGQILSPLLRSDAELASAPGAAPDCCAATASLWGRHNRAPRLR